MKERRVFLVLLVTGAVCFLPMLAHQSDTPQVLGRYSPTYTAMLLVMAALVLGAGAGYALARADRLPMPALPRARWFGAAVVAANAVLVSAVWLVVQPGSQHLPAIGLFRVYLVLVVAAGAFVLLRASGTGAVMLPRRWELALVVASAAVALALAALYLGKVPPVRHYDEPQLVNSAWTTIVQGRPTEGMHPIRTTAFVGLIFSWPYTVLGAWMKLVGVGLSQARLFWLMVGWGAVPFIYLAARRLYGPAAALSAALIAVFIPLKHNYVHADVFVMTTASIALYLFLVARERESRLAHFAVGFVLALGTDGHKYALSFVAAFGMVYVVGWVRTRRAGGLGYFVLGVLAYVPFFIAVFFLRIQEAPDIGKLVSLIREVYAVEAAAGGETALIPRIIAQNIRLYQDYLSSHPVEVVLGLGGILAALRRRREADIKLLLLFFAYLVGFGVLLAHSNPYYWIQNMPFVALFGGALVAQRAASRINLVTLAALVSLLIPLAISTAILAREGDGARLIEVAREIDRLLPEDITVAGWQIYYLGMPERVRFVSSLQITAAPPEEWGIPPPRAVILSRGFDDVHQSIRDYLETAGLEKAYCYPTGFFDGETVLYLPPELLPESAPVGCRNE